MAEKLKIAFVTKNKKNIVGTFGSTKYFKVYNIESGKIVNQEEREVFVDEADDSVPNIMENSGTSGPKFSLNVVDKSKEKHMKIAKSISDCNVVIARGMCANAWDSIEKFNMTPILTTNKDFEPTIDEYLKGSLVNHKENIH